MVLDGLICMTSARSALILFLHSLLYGCFIGAANAGYSFGLSSFFLAAPVNDKRQLIKGLVLWEMYPSSRLLNQSQPWNGKKRGIPKGCRGSCVLISSDGDCTRRKLPHHGLLLLLLVKKKKKMKSLEIIFFYTEHEWLLVHFWDILLKQKHELVLFHWTSQKNQNVKLCSCFLDTKYTLCPRMCCSYIRICSQLLLTKKEKKQTL